MEQGIDELSKLGFELTGQGRLTVSMKCTRKSFEKAFGTTLAKVQLDMKENYTFILSTSRPRVHPGHPYLRN